MRYRILGKTGLSVSEIGLGTSKGLVERLPREEGERLVARALDLGVNFIDPARLDGDGEADRSVHGGVHKAAYAYPREHYGDWSRELGRSDFTFGQFGENFTVEGMLEDEIRIGDVFRVGAARVEVTQPRMPCYKLGIRMGMERFPKLFMASGRSGFYLKVVEEGEVGAGDRFEPVGHKPEGITVRALWHLAYRERDNLEGAKAALRLTSLGPEWRQLLANRLIKAGIPVE